MLIKIHSKKCLVLVFGVFWLKIISCQNKTCTIIFNRKQVPGWFFFLWKSFEKPGERRKSWEWSYLLVSTSFWMMLWGDRIISEDWTKKAKITLCALEGWSSSLTSITLIKLPKNTICLCVCIVAKMLTQLTQCVHVSILWQTLVKSPIYMWTQCNRQ